MPLIKFVMILLALFTIELMGPVQTWVIEPFTANALKYAYGWPLLLALTLAAPKPQ